MSARGRSSTPRHSPRTSRTASPADPLEPLLRELAVTKAELAEIPSEFVSETVGSLSFSRAQKAQIFLALAKLNPANATPAPTTESAAKEMGTQLRREALYKRQPWQCPRDAQLERLAGFEARFLADTAAGTDPLEALRAQFVTKARGRTIAAPEAATLHHILFGGPRGAFMLANLLLNVPASERVAFHNWLAATRWDEAVVTSRGAAVERLQWPLFPETASFDKLAFLNEELLLEGFSGGEPAHTPNVFRPTDGTLYGGACWQQ